MGLDVELLRASFEQVVARDPALTHRFYNVLFDRYPQVKPLFGRNSRTRQEKMLTEALVAVVDHLEDAPWLEHQLGAMGAKHVEYGVTDEMYEWVGDSLLRTLAEVAGEAWTPAVAAAWPAAYGAISGLMKKGAAGSRAD